MLVPVTGIRREGPKGKLCVSLRRAPSASIIDVRWMKTLTTREFFHSPGLVKAMRAGQSIIVTDKGKPALIVTKAGRPARKTRADREREAMEICPEARPKVNFTAALKELKTKRFTRVTW